MLYWTEMATYEVCQTNLDLGYQQVEIGPCFLPVRVGRCQEPRQTVALQDEQKSAVKPSKQIVKERIAAHDHLRRDRPEARTDRLRTVGF